MLLGGMVAAEQIVGQAAPDIGDMRAGQIAGATSGMVALVSGGLLCMATVALMGATTAELHRSSMTLPDEQHVQHVELRLALEEVTVRLPVPVSHMVNHTFVI